MSNSGYEGVRRSLPRFLDRYLWRFENSIEDAVAGFAKSLRPHALLLDAGAGEGQYKSQFGHVRYIGVDLAVGDAAWNYGSLDAIADLCNLSFRAGIFDACLNIVTLEHVRRPDVVVREMGRVLRPGGRLLLVAPQDWQVHQAPHDYFRYTRYGLEYLLQDAGFREINVQPGGGYFQLMGRRMLNGIQLVPGIWKIPAALMLGPAGVLFPLFDGLDRNKDFTLGYICTATKG